MLGTRAAALSRCWTAFLTGVMSCAAAESDEKFAELIKYLIMARKKGAIVS